MIHLIDFLKASGIEVNPKPESVKVHLACWNGREHPIDEYYAGRFKTWQEDQGKRNFNCDQVIGLIDLGQSNWLFAGLYKVLGCEQFPSSFKYSTELISGQKELIGRIVVHHKRCRASYIWSRPELSFPIVEIRREKLFIEDFPGHNAVILSHRKLKIIIDEKIPSWHGALANVKGVYLITDTTTGTQYVGKASGSDGIWQRWCCYSKDGHGGNSELKKLLKEKGLEHKAHYQYSILEIADTHASENDILKRESYWMKVLLTRKFGLN